MGIADGVFGVQHETLEELDLRCFGAAMLFTIWALTLHPLTSREEPSTCKPDIRALEQMKSSDITVHQTLHQRGSAAGPLLAAGAS